MTEPTQTELDDERRNNVLVSKQDVINAIDEAFEEVIEKLKSRSSYDQTVIGNFYTVVEGELQNKIKILTEHKR